MVAVKRDVQAKILLHTLVAAVAKHIGVVALKKGWRGSRSQ